MENNNQDFMQYIAAEFLYLIPVLWIIGAIIRNIPGVKNWIIPFVLLIFGILFCVLLAGVTAAAIIQGILVAGAAVLGDQVVKQVKKAGNE